MEQMGGKSTQRLCKESSQSCWFVPLFVHAVRFAVPGDAGCLRGECSGIPMMGTVTGHQVSSCFNDLFQACPKAET